MTTTNIAPTANTRSLPLLGHAMRLLRDPWTFLSDARDQAPVVRIRIGLGDAYVVSRPDLIRQVLTADAKKYAKGVQFDKLRPIIGNGLVTAAGEEHLKHRRLVQPAFHHTRIAGYAMTMRDLALATTHGWRDGDRMEMDRELAHLTLRVVGKTLFSTELGTEVVDEVVRSMPTVLSGITKRALSPLPILEKLPTAENRAFAAANARLREVVDRIIAGYRASGEDHGDMVSMLLLARDEETGEGLSDEQVRDEVITMLLAGTETTANALCWALHVLGERPDLEIRLHGEVDEVLGDGELTFETIRGLAFTKRFVTEVLRMYPPAWLITRRTTQETELGGVTLPAGASVMFSPYTVHRDPAVYADPDTFDPDRWLPGRPEIPRPSFVPFGAGNRQCIGEAFAWTEAIIVLATIARRWRLTPVPGVEVRMNASATLTPSSLPMVARMRHPAAASSPLFAMAG